jgi:hypothetical protein
MGIGSILDLERLSDGTVLAVGDFDTADGLPANNLARWNGTAWEPVGGGIQGSISAAQQLPNGEIVVAGSFSVAGGVSASRIARWNGTGWSAFGSGLNNTVAGVHVTGAGEVFAVGRFLHTQSSPPIVGAARWTGASWVSMGVRIPPFFGSAACVKELSNGEVWIGGSFLIADDEVAPYLLRGRLNPDAPLIIEQPVSTDACPPASAVLRTRAAGSAPIAYQWQWRPAPEGPWVDLLDGLNIDPGGGPRSVTAAGAIADELFLTDIAGGGSAFALAVRVRVSDACGLANSDEAQVFVCPADFDCSGSISVVDIFVFLSAWFAGDARADLDGIIGVAVPDIFAFLSAWFAGC